MAVSVGQAPRRAFGAVFGVDFSGAKQAGRTTWIARLDPDEDGAHAGFRLGALDRLDRLAGTAERRDALAHLVRLVGASANALWALDFPFGLPVELFPPRARWPRQLALVREYAADDYGLGLECVRRARSLGGKMHIRRQTDVDARAPFDPYHYRIIYQTFYGIHDVLAPLWRDARTAVLPFQYHRLDDADRVLVEACPGSTLKRLGLPHQNYKQPAGGPLTRKRRLTRRRIVDAIAACVRVTPRARRVMMRDPGADAIDAVLAALGAAQAFATADHSAIARHGRYPREGHLYF
ncbi:MAG TPA: hypothetical protein VM076_05275 [Gemmatimonadaceae bacterium]|nr:hypothetical protein [Gemmatimonadaceae bacterium]